MPKVSIIIPCFNEQKTINQLLEAILNQTYPLSQIEVIISDGLSTDITRTIIEQFCETHPKLFVKIIDNPKRQIPHGLNLALKSASGEYIIRLDAHSMPYPDYVSRCIKALEEGRGDNVGGLWEIRPVSQGWIAQSIALAAINPMGVGDARYRVGGKAQEVETVPFGAFKKSIFDEIGYYNENLLTNEDYELNVRIKLSGRKIWFDPEIKSIYFSRSTFTSLAHQYSRYGYWKARMLRIYPKSIRWRQLIPPIFVLVLIFSFMVGLLLKPFLIFVSITIGLYLLVIFGVAFRASFIHKDWKLIPGISLAFIIMHFAWGSSFLWSMFKR